jgi:hypothetical protein
MTIRYYLFAVALLTAILYLSKEMRDKGVLSQLPRAVTDLIPTSLKGSAPRHLEYDPRLDTKETQRAVKEKDALQEWIHSQLTQKGLKEMTEAGHYQSEHSNAL